MGTVVSMSPVPAPLLEQWIVSQLGNPDLKVAGVHEADEATRHAALVDAEIVLGDYTFQHRIDEALLEHAPKLKFVQQPSVGYQHIDLEACRRRGVAVANTPGVNSASVAEHTIMMAMALLRRVPYANEQTHRGQWTQRELMWEQGVFELAGKNFGIVGMGHVGREVAKRLVAFGTRNYYYDPFRLQPEQEKELHVQFKPLEHLLRLCDVISLHVPLTDETRNMINADSLAKMKFNAILINVARGECIDEAALAERLRAKKLGGAGIDVFATEPIPADSPLLGAPNVLLTPHIAGATSEVRERVVQMAVANVVRVLRGEAPEHVLNPA